jgi:hypothetical protein
MNERRCPYCQQVFQPVPYHPQQRICSRPACQRQRRRDYHRQKIASDPVYRQVCRDSPRNWRQAHPGYWKQYRQTHPQQVERNHQQQWRRDQKRRLANLLRNTHAATGTTLRPSVRACARSLASARTRQSFSCLTNTVAS